MTKVFFFLNLEVDLRNSAPGKLAYIWQIEWVEINNNYSPKWRWVEVACGICLLFTFKNSDFGADFCGGAKLSRTHLESGSSHIGLCFYGTLQRSVKRCYCYIGVFFMSTWEAIRRYIVNIDLRLARAVATFVALPFSTRGRKSPFHFPS